ncbi:MAG: hypothetical protein M0R80_30605 [Proteobacteria bacterium]|jgi:hypothetical protein|nr:hypothetical protein [Pseudomonadota bacterium]
MSGKPQIKLAAVKVGDLLKYSTTINEINRTASSVFNFNCESFPIEGITSQRAKLIFDWLMTLFKQSISDAEKRDLAKAFLTNITPENERPQIFRVLVDTGIMDTAGDAVEAAPTAEAPAEAELLKRVFRPEVFGKLPLDATLSAALVGRMSEAQVCIEANAYLAAVILCGSVLEGMCLGFGSRHPERVNRAYASRYNKPAKEFHDWKLREWIDVLGYQKDLSPNVEKFGQALRDFRNYVHPAEQLANQFYPDQHTARIGFQVVVAAADDLVRAETILMKEAVS